MGVLFGTDGVRGVANKDLTADLAMKIGRCGAYVLAGGQDGAKIVIGRDTRISGDMLEAALVAGICSAGVDVIKVGILPTPAIAFLTRDLGACGGVVVSASHNPVEDNGIKYFGPGGHKLPDEIEEEIEKLITGPQSVYCGTGAAVGRSVRLGDAESRYINFLKRSVPVDLAGLRIVLDCANGAASYVAPKVMADLGAEIVSLYNHPDGLNINKDCGSTHLAGLQKKVVECGADLGLAYDGDADRMLAVDSNGKVVDGDQIMVICACHLKKKGRLAENTVVTTVMSNIGMRIALKKRSINVLETKVGDRYVLEECLNTGARFGGEQSGHIIFLDHNTTGDGLLTSLNLLTVMKESGKSLAELASKMERLPQILKNVRVADKDAVMSSPALAGAIARAEERLAGQGRVLIRPSGTEPLVRVMAEGRDPVQLSGLIDELVAVVESLA